MAKTRKQLSKAERWHRKSDRKTTGKAGHKRWGGKSKKRTSCSW